MSIFLYCRLGDSSEVQTSNLDSRDTLNFNSNTWETPIKSPQVCLKRMQSYSGLLEENKRLRTELERKKMCGPLCQLTGKFTEKRHQQVCCWIQWAFYCLRDYVLYRERYYSYFIIHIYCHYLLPLLKKYVKRRVAQTNMLFVGR